MARRKNLGHHFAAVLLRDARKFASTRQKQNRELKEQIKKTFETGDGEERERLIGELSFNRILLDAIMQEIKGWRLCVKYEDRRFHGKMYGASVLASIRKMQEEVKKTGREYEDMRIDLLTNRQMGHRLNEAQYKVVVAHYNAALKAFQLAASV